MSKVISKPVGLCVSTHDSNSNRFLDGARRQNARRVLVPHERAWLVECLGTWAVHMACRNGALALISVHGTWDGLNVPCGMGGNGANFALHGRGYCERDWPRA